MYSVIKYQDLEFVIKPLFQPNAAYKGLLTIWDFRFEISNSRVACGDVAQLGEHLICIQGVAGSIPVISTTFTELLYAATGWNKGSV